MTNTVRKSSWDYVFVLLQFLLFAAYLTPWPWDAAIGLGLPPSLHWIVIGLGVFLLAWAFLQLQTNLTPWPTPRKAGYLVTTGIYRHVRHPMYSGVFLVLVGWALYRQNVNQVIISGLLLVIFYFKSRYEEKQLMRRFPRYAEYRHKSGRFMPPFPPR